MPSYVTQQQVEDYITAQLKLRAADEELEPNWDVIIPHAMTYAYTQIRRRLLKQGYTGTQIDSWDERVPYSLDLATWFACRDLSNLEGDDTWIEKFNRAEELSDEEFALLVDGELAEVSTANADIHYGRMEIYSDLDETFIGGDAVE